MTTSGDPGLPSEETVRRDTLLQHKGSREGARPEYLRHMKKITSLSDPSSMLAQDSWRYGDRATLPPLKPMYTEKLPTTPAFKSLAELNRRRQNFWSKVIGRGALVLMVAALLGALKWGTGVFPAGAFVVGLIVFVAVCFTSGCRNRSQP